MRAQGTYAHHGKRDTACNATGPYLVSDPPLAPITFPG